MSIQYNNLPYSLNSNNYIIVIKAQSLTIYTQMEGFQIRFADTGHPQIYQNVGSIQMLQQMIFKDYKIQKNNQRLYTKKGLIITANNKIDLITDMKKTFVSGEVGDKNQNYKTTKKGIYLFNHKQLLKNTSAIDQSNRAQYLLQSKSIIDKRHENSKDLRYGCYEVAPFETKFNSQEKVNILLTAYPQTELLFTRWYKYAREIFNLWHNFKENEICFDEYIQKLQNQRKALITLSRNLENVCGDKKNILQRLMSSLQIAKNRLKQSHSALEMNLPRKDQLQQNLLQFQSGFNALEQASKKLKNLESSQSVLSTKAKNFQSHIKASYERLEKKLRKIDDYKHKKSKQLEKVCNRSKEAYTSICEGANEKIEKENDNKLVSIIAQQQQIQASLKQSLKTMTDAITENQQKFAELYSIYLDHIQIVKVEYKKYYELFYEIEEVLKLSLAKYERQLESLHKQVDELIKSISKNSLTPNLSSSQSLITPMLTPLPSQMLASSKPNQAGALLNLPANLSDKRSQLAVYEQNEQKRRNHFNSKLIVLHQQIKQLLRDEENNRKRLLAQVIALDEMYDNQILCNTRVPCFLINYDQCTDKQLINKFKSSSAKDIINNRQNMNGFDGIDIELYRQGKGMDRILKQLEIIKNCQSSLKTESSSSTSSSPLEHKIKCMQVLLQKSSDIFHNIYQTKLAHITKNYQHTLRQYQHQATLLDKQNKQLKDQIMRYGQSIMDTNVKINDIIRQNADIKNEAIKNIREAEQSKNKIQIQLSDAIKKCQNYQNTVEENKKEIMKLKVEKRQVEDRLAKQVTGTMETLYFEFEKLAADHKDLQQVNHEYKIVMGDQAVKIATLETQLLVLKGQTEHDIHSQNKKDKLQNSFYGEQIRKIKSTPQQKSENNSSYLNQGDFQNQQKHDNNLIDAPLMKKNSKSITSQELKQIQRQISKYEKQIEELKAENEELKEENTGLSQQIMKIAMRDTEDVEIQTDTETSKAEKQPVINSIKSQAQVINPMTVTNMLSRSDQSIKIEGNPQIGQLRLFIPFNPGTYISIKCPPSSSATNHILNFTSVSATSPTLMHMNVGSLMQEQNWPYLLDMNCLTSKARELLTECTLIVVIRVTKVLEAEGLMRHYVEGDILNAIGFQDDDMVIKDYGQLLK